MMAAEHQAALRGRLRHDESMARHVSWRTGGPARTFYEPADAGDLAVFLKQLPADEPLLWLGLGSNLLVRDGGIPGTVIATSGALMELVQIDALAIRAGTGVACNKVARFCAGLNLVTQGGETWPLVRRVETIDRHGTRRWHEPGDFRVAYREVHGPAEEWFITVELQLQSGDGAAGLARVKELLERRNRSQPIGLPSCGSVFRNPPGDHAARLIEACGLKGTCRGGACISTKHANFIINSGDASAADIEALITQVAEAVEQAHGVRLQREVHIVGVAAGGVQS
ncbi:MAG: UDP-N-acetylenolpyruvoylglucosamine reductase [Gammaproteobacteria bacterium]